MRKTLALLLCLTITGMSGSALAHGFTRPQHGGVVQMSGETLFELVTAPTGVSLYVIDEDDPVNAAAMSAKLSVTTGGRKAEVTMAPAGGNRFFARGLRLTRGANVGVQVIDNATKARLGTTFIIK